MSYETGITISVYFKSYSQAEKEQSLHATCDSKSAYT